MRKGTIKFIQGTTLCIFAYCALAIAGPAGAQPSGQPQPAPAYSDERGALPARDDQIVPRGGMRSGGRGPYAPEGMPLPSENPRSFEGIWLNSRFEINALKDVWGEPLPYNAQAQNRVLHQLSMINLGTPVIESNVLCLPSGLGRDLQVSFPIEFAHTPDQVIMMQEEGRALHVIRLNSEHPENLVPSFNGDSIGWWEGNTLVVDTIGFNGETTIDQAGSPLSDEAHVVWRVTRVNKGGPYEDLEIIMTVDDPVNYTTIFSVMNTYRWRPDRAAYENNCEEGNFPENTEDMILENPDLIVPEGAE